MPRLPEVGSRAITNPFVKAIYHNKFGDQEFDTAPGNPFGVKGNWETTVANSQEALAIISRSISWMYDTEKFTLPQPLRELALLRLGWLVQSQFVFSQRCKIARSCGVTQDQIDAIPAWPVSDLFSPAERAVLAYTDALTVLDARVPDQLFNALKQHLTAEQIVDLTHAVNQYIGYAKMSRAFMVEFDTRPDPIIEVAAPEGFEEHMPVLDISKAEKTERESA
ncbi:carboxymuconolactone decarboxylase family protein [Novosphingobium beihaiensis]|uniref:Carboxymuconolactone decarboxylase family protein n=1 Tax=Novosphingobium beihaiensis TaxID=2930389 RepID=A0ABT0BRG5_9SPHN|nr:carboxymuconolactone decarboxylase family protein [Novosphingobium beihaiensis]MCJ2187631.1 carboxymuconolactone decarboxylase family protein [Novosphingobium beihaiensis]